MLSCCVTEAAHSPLWLRRLFGTRLEPERARPQSQESQERLWTFRPLWQHGGCMTDGRGSEMHGSGLSSHEQPSENRQFGEETTRLRYRWGHGAE